MSSRRTRITVGLIALTSGIASLWVATELFPYRSLNHDEAVYLQQAAMLLEGKLYLSPPVEEAFQPWFFVDGPNGLYSKYTPPTAALWALSKFLTGSWFGLLPVVAGAGVVFTYGTVAEAFESQTGVLAALLWAASPLVVVQSGTFLSYLPTSVCLLGFLCTYLRGCRLDSRRYAAAAGLLVGLAFFARPYTAVLFAIPAILHAAVTLAGARGRWDVLSHHGLTATLGVLWVGIALGYNSIVTGDPLQFPYQAFAPLDGPGFGTRRLLGYEREFTPLLGVRATRTALERFARFWVAGGPLTIGLAALGAGRLLAITRRNWPPSLPNEVTAAGGRWIVAGIALPVILGNIAFWGTLNAMGDPANPGGLLLHLGPFYHVDLLLPVTALGAWALLGLWNRLHGFVICRPLPAGHRGAILAVAAILIIATLGGVTTLAAAEVHDRNREVTDTYESAYEPFENRSLENDLIYLPQLYGPWLNHPFQPLRNDPSYDEGPVYALREASPIAVAEAFPTRDRYRFVLRGAWAPPLGVTVDTALRPVTVVAGEQVTIDIAMGIPAAYDTVSVHLETGGEDATYAVTPTDESVSVALDVTPAGAQLTGTQVSSVSGPDRLTLGDDITMWVYLDVGTGAGVTYRLETPVDPGTDHVTVMTPYRELCTVSSRCGGAAAAIPGHIPEGLYINTSLSVQKPLLETDREDRPGNRSTTAERIQRRFTPTRIVFDRDFTDIVSTTHRTHEQFS